MTDDLTVMLRRTVPTAAFGLLATQLAREGIRLMRRTVSRQTVLAALFVLCAVALAPAPAQAQRHSMGAAPPTAPPPRLLQPALSSSPAGPIAAVSSGMGAIQFLPANFSVPAPQALTRQLEAEDERARVGALSSIGAPGQYLTRGHIPFPHSVQLDLVQLSNSEELDALLTVELDQHLVSAVLVPDGDGWRRVATLLFANAFSNASTTPSTFVRPLRSWLQPGRYRAVYHASVAGPSGDFTENEADLRIVNNRAVIVLDFVSGARQCDPLGQIRPPHQTCELIQRWLEPDPTDPTHHFTLITGVGHFSAREATDPLSGSRNFRLTHLRSFACQPFVFSEVGMHFEPTANSGPCSAHDSSRADSRPESRPGSQTEAKPDFKTTPGPL